MKGTHKDATSRGKYYEKQNPTTNRFFSHLKYKESIVLVNNPVAYKDMPAIIKR